MQAPSKPHIGGSQGILLKYPRQTKDLRIMFRRVLFADQQPYDLKSSRSRPDSRHVARRLRCEPALERDLAILLDSLQWREDHMTQIQCTEQESVLHQGKVRELRRRRSRAEFRNCANHAECGSTGFSDVSQAMQGTAFLCCTPCADGFDLSRLTLADKIAAT